MSGATYEMPKGPEEKRDLPLRICLTRSEFDTLHELAIQSKLMASSTEGDVVGVVEEILSTILVGPVTLLIAEYVEISLIRFRQDERGLLALIREELEP